MRLSFAGQQCSKLQFVFLCSAHDCNAQSSWQKSRLGLQRCARRCATGSKWQHSWSAEAEGHWMASCVSQADSSASSGPCSVMTAMCCHPQLRRAAHGRYALLYQHLTQRLTLLSQAGSSAGAEHPQAPGLVDCHRCWAVQPAAVPTRPTCPLRIPRTPMHGHGRQKPTRPL